MSLYYAILNSSIRDNKTSSGTDIGIEGGYNSDAREQTIVFTPTAGAGWYRLLKSWNRYFSSSNIRISRKDPANTDNSVIDNAVVDLEFNYAVIANTTDTAQLGEITLLQFNEYNPSPITQIRIGNTGGSQTAYVDIYLNTYPLDRPLLIRSSGGKNHQFETIPVYMGTGSEVAPVKVLALGRGIRTTGAIYAGQPNTQVTDAAGKVLSAAINTIQPAQGGLGADNSSLAADRFAYTIGSGVFGYGILTAFGRSIIDDADAAAGRTTLGVQIGTDVQGFSPNLATLASLSTTAGNVIVGNGSAWSSAAVSGDGSLASSGALTVNKLTPGANSIQGYNSNTLSGTFTLTTSDARIQHLKTAAAGTSQIVKLPNVAVGREFMIHNIGTRGVNTNLIVQNSAGVEQFQLSPGFFTLAQSRGSDAWEFQTFGRNQPFTVTMGEIDAKTVASTPLLTVPTGLNFMTTALLVETTTLTGSPSTATPAFCMGTALGTSNNIVAMQILNSGGGVALNTYREYLPRNDAARLAAGSVLTFRLSTNSTATTHKLTLHVTGFYR